MAVTDRDPLRARPSLAQRALDLLHSKQIGSRANRQLPFNRVYRTGSEEARIGKVLDSGWTAGNGPQSAYCETLLTNITQACRVVLTHSCTGALEMAAPLPG